MPKKAIYPDDVLRMAATLYYVDGLGQNEVADVNFSRLISNAVDWVQRD